MRAAGESSSPESGHSRSRSRAAGKPEAGGRSSAPHPAVLEFRRPVPMQPRPITALVARYPTGGGYDVVGIARVWAPGDTANCRLCPSCHATNDTCLIVGPVDGARRLGLEEILGYTVKAIAPDPYPWRDGGDDEVAGRPPSPLRLVRAEGGAL